MSLLRRWFRSLCGQVQRSRWIGHLGEAWSESRWIGRWMGWLGRGGSVGGRWCVCWGCVLVCVGEVEAAEPTTKPAKRFQHAFEGRLHITSDHTGLDSGVAPEVQYRFRMDRILDLRAGIRYAPPGAGDALRYYVGGFVHIPLPLVRDGSLGILMMHNSYGDIQKGENSVLFLHHVDTRYFAFDGGLVLRMELTRPEVYRNPLYFGTEYLEVFYVYDMRVKIDFRFPKLGGSVLEIGAGIMNFLDNEVLGPATGGYRLYASWDQPGVGRFEAMGGMYSYGFWAFAGYYGRWFLRFSYTYALDV